jgi:hypothetical protein
VYQTELNKVKAIDTNNNTLSFIPTCLLSGNRISDTKVGIERCKWSNRLNWVLETEAMIILEQHRVKKGPMEKITRAGDFHASEVK